MTKTQKEKIEELFYQGFNNTEIAKQVGLERHSVGRYIKQNNLINSNTILPNQRFGKLITIKPTIERDSCGRIMWLCQCDCGNQIKVSSSLLKNGNTKSCGCSRLGNGLIDLTNQKFGKLTVIKRFEENFRNRPQWLCQCDCGNLKIVPGEYLRQGYTKSCGCLTSEGERIIESILKEEKVDYKKQFVFDDLLSSKKHPLRFDFAIFKEDKISYLIEFQGIQHYDKNNIWHTKELEENDNKKIEYCRKNNYNLILINDINQIKNVIKEIL